MQTVVLVRVRVNGENELSARGEFPFSTLELHTVSKRIQSESERDLLWAHRFPRPC
jgi:hypothetical protein